MHTIIQTTAPRPPSRAPRYFPKEYRQPSYDCREHPEALKITVYVPGVEASGVSIEVNGPDLIVTARKPHVVRVNWQALHLEGSQRDYRMRLRLGNALKYDALQAELSDGVLTLHLPKRLPAGPTDRELQVA